MGLHGFGLQSWLVSWSEHKECKPLDSIDLRGPCVLLAVKSLQPPGGGSQSATNILG